MTSNRELGPDAGDFQQIVSDAIEGMTPDDILELGVSIIARGLHRKKISEGPKEAERSALAVVSTFRSTALDMMRLATLSSSKEA